MLRLICGVVEAGHGVESERARDLTISSLRWGYFGRIIVAGNVDDVLTQAADGPYDFCLIQCSGHTIIERSGVQGRAALPFFEALDAWASDGQFLAAGRRAAGGVEAGLDRRCLLVDLNQYRGFGKPRFEAMPPDASVLAGSCSGGSQMRKFDAEVEGYLLDLGSDLKLQPQYLEALTDQSIQAQSGVFVLNFEPYSDIEAPPADFEGPVSLLYSVAAGLKPNRILETHGFNQQTRVVYFDYSQCALEFRRMLLANWDGRDYPAFLRSLTRLMPSSTHYYLWPGASPDALNGAEMEHLWVAETLRWGGPEAFADHWARYQSLRHDFLHRNILTECGEILRLVQDRDDAVIWWSNAFSTVYSAWNFSVAQKRHVYENWIRDLAQKAPRMLLYGSDHSNSGVNRIRAAAYWQAYRADGGDPLTERHFCDHQIRF